MISLILTHMQIGLYISACNESADQYIISADIILRKCGRFVVIMIIIIISIFKEDNVFSIRGAHWPSG